MTNISGDKYEAVTVDSGYHKYMLLKIRAVAGSDFGAYRCVASNPLGDADGVVKLDGKDFQTIQKLNINLHIHGVNKDLVLLVGVKVIKRNKKIFYRKQ